MALQVTHSFVSSKPDGPDPSKVRPSNWNAAHTVTGSLGSDQLSANNTWTGTNTFNSKVTAVVNAVSFSATPSFNAALGNHFRIILTGNVTSSTVINLSAGQRLTFFIVQDGTGGHTFAWPNNVVGGNTVAAGANAVTMQEFVTHDGTTLYAIKGEQGAQGAQGPQGNAGATGAAGQGFTWSGTWSNSTAYEPYDVVEYNGSTYVAISSTSIGQDPATATSEWDVLAAKGDTGAAGADGSPGADGNDGAPGADGSDGADGADGQGFEFLGAWSSATAYVPYDVVEYFGSSYVCIGNTTNEAPDVTPGKWTLFAQGESTKIITINHTNSPYTVLPSDGTIVCDQTTDNVVLNLPSAADHEGKKYIAKVKGTTNIVYLTPDGMETIDGETSVNLDSQWGYREIQSDGTNWMVTGQYGTSAAYRNPFIPSAAALSSYVITPTNADYEFTDNETDITLGFVSGTPVGHPIGLYRPGGLGTSGNFTFEVHFVPTTSMADFIGIGFRDDSGGGGALSIWGMKIGSGNYQVRQDHYWNDTGWFNWNFYNNTNIGSSGSPPPGNLFKMRFQRTSDDITCGWQIDGTNWVTPHVMEGWNVINLFVYVSGSESIDIKYLRLT